MASWSLPGAIRSGLGEPERRRDLALLTAVLALTLAVHAPALGSAFARDDQLLLYDAVNLPLLEYLLDMHGGHLMPAHKIVIVLMHAAFGYEATPFFVLAVATHLLNAGLLFAILRHLVNAPLAAFGAALWASAIIHQSSLRWFSVYGQILAATCFLIVLLEWTRLGTRRDKVTRAALARWNTLLLIGGTSFGVGIALAVAAPWVALAFVRRSLRRRAFLGLLPAALIVPTLYGVAFGYTGSASGPLANVFLPSVGMTLLLDLPAAGLTSLLFGSAATPGDTAVLWGPLSSRSVESAFVPLRLAGIAVGTAIAVGFWFASWPLRRRMIGAAILCIAVYGMIAFGRTQMAFLMNLAQIAMEPRYHYTGLIGAALLITLGISAVAQRLARRRSLARIRGLSAAGALLALTMLAIQVIPALRFSRTIQQRNIDNSKAALKNALNGLKAVIAAAPPGRDLYILNRDYEATRNLFGVRNNPERFPGIAALFALTHESDTVDGKRVRFVETRAELLAQIRSQPDRRIARLLLSGEEASALGVRVYQLPP